MTTTFTPRPIKDPVLVHQPDLDLLLRQARRQMETNMRWALDQDFARFEIYQGQRNKPVALVGLGPSLADTWTQLHDFDYIISTSGAHRYLLDRGIVPTWHVEVDWREHKIDLMGQPNDRVQYLPASTCHPKMFEHLAGYDFRLWTPLLSAESEHDSEPYHPLGEILINGGSTAAARAMFIANLLGFSDLHFFGVDYSFPAGHVGEHVIDHPTKASIRQRLDLKGPDGTVYHTVHEFWSWAIEFFILRRRLQQHGMMLTLHGDGMLADLARKNYTLEDGTKDVSHIVIATIKHETPEQARAYERANQYV